ncbi:MAG: protein kinase domain-containing protein, partial [Planctomycetota bacterium]
MAEDPSIGDGRTLVPGARAAGVEPIGSRIAGRYEIVSVLGQGGMGVVYECRDLQLGRRVAVKRMLVTTGGHERFLREARVVAALDHPGIVAVHNLGADAQGPYIDMAFLQGADLGSWVKQHGALAPQELLRVAREICRALAYAHGRDVIHRDLKPSNLFRLPDGTIKLLDFGLARVEEDAGLSMVGVGMGTAEYAAPEQREDASRVDARTDIFSLGATLYFLATAKPPRMMSERHLPEQMRELVVALVEERPDDRPASALDVASQIERVEVALGYRPPPNAAMSTRQCSQCRATIAGTAKFCPECGAAVGGRAGQASAASASMPYPAATGVRGDRLTWAEMLEQRPDAAVVT